MTTLLGAADLTWMQATQQSVMPNGTVVIYRMTAVADGMGGFTETWPAVGTVQGRIYSMNSRAYAEQEAGGQLVSTTRWYGTLPTGTNVTAADRLGANGRKWHVASVNNDQDWQTAVRCELQSLNEDTP